MAYMSQEKKKRINVELKPVLKKYGIQATLAVRHHSTLVLNIKAGKIDFINNYNNLIDQKHNGQTGINIPYKAVNYVQINPYWYQDHFTGTALNFLSEVSEIMNNGNHDRSDIQTDYFDVGWYTDINIGNWQRPYIIN